MARELRCSALVATRNRWELLVGRALPSIQQQTRSVDQVVVVNDGAPRPTSSPSP